MASLPPSPTTPSASLARPIGGIVFGHFGDKYGRKRLLQLSLIMVGAATFFGWCLPVFGQIGYWAPASW
jgi:MFS family permease